MGCRRWNPKTLDRRIRHGTRRTHGATGGRALLVGAVLVALSVITGGAVAMSHVAGPDPGPDKVGICHATGTAENPFVFIVVDRGGADHGHHSGHADDVVGVASEADCPTLATQQAAETTSATHCTSATPSAAPETDAAEQAEAAAPETDVADEAEAPEAAAQEAPAATEACPGDVAVTNTPALTADEAQFTLVVASLGPLRAKDVTLANDLPDLGGLWTLGGTDADACTLEGLALACEFGDLSAGQSRTVTATSPRCSLDCGPDLVTTATATASNDGDPSNDVAEATVPMPECEPAPTTAPTGSDDADPTPASDEPAPTDTSNASDDEPDDANASDEANATDNTSEPAEGANATEDENATVDDNETGANETPAAEPEPAPAGDAAVRNTATQTLDQVTLTMRVTNVGDGEASDVYLRNVLPDVDRPWFLGGADASACTLVDEDLTCWFGTLAPGESREVLVKAYTDRMHCGQHVVNTAWLSAGNDDRPDNDRSSASIEARGC